MKEGDNLWFWPLFLKRSLWLQCWKHSMREKGGNMESSHEATAIISERDYGGLNQMIAMQKWLQPG